jgi:hypothetical protein
MSAIIKNKGAGGRPPKFSEGSRPITVTLPKRILQSLERVSPDRARALVKCVEAALGKDHTSHAPAELIEVLPGKALIVVNSNRTLCRIEWLRLIEIAPARYLLVLPPGLPIERLELEMSDLLENLAEGEKEERPLLDQLQKLLTQQRRQKTISKGELLLVDL